MSNKIRISHAALSAFEEQDSYSFTCRIEIPKDFAEKAGTFNYFNAVQMLNPWGELVDAAEIDLEALLALVRDKKKYR